MVMSHFPIHHTALYDNANASAEYYMSMEAEVFATDGHDFKPCDTTPCRTVGELTGDFQSVLHPIFVEYGVDIYNAGHIHDYQSMYVGPPLFVMPTWTLETDDGSTLFVIRDM